MREIAGLGTKKRVKGSIQSNSSVRSNNRDGPGSRAACRLSPPGGAAARTLI